MPLYSARYYFRYFDLLYAGVDWPYICETTVAYPVAALLNWNNCRMIYAVVER